MSEPTSSIPFHNASAPAAVVEDAPSRDTGPQYRPSSMATDDAPPSLYQAVESKPYAVKHLGLELYHGDPDFPDVVEQARALDEYVLEQVKARGLKDDGSSYKEVVDAIYKQIGRSPNEDPVKTLKRLSTAAMAIARLEKAKMPPVLSAKNLSPSEYEDVLA